MKLNSMNAAIAIVLALGVGACGSGDDKTNGPTNTTPEEVQVELFSWWVNPGEAEALQALVDLNKERFPHERIYNRAADSGSNAKQELSDRLEADDPPDLFQQNAHDMRQLVRKRIDEGFSDAQIYAFMQERYGDRALMSPPATRQTWLLWYGPALVFVLLFFGYMSLWKRTRRS